jgi:hypothetical protein
MLRKRRPFQLSTDQNLLDLAYNCVVFCESRLYWAIDAETHDSFDFFLDRYAKTTERIGELQRAQLTRRILEDVSNERSARLRCQCVARDVASCDRAQANTRSVDTIIGTTSWILETWKVGQQKESNPIDSIVLENCILNDPVIGKNPHTLAGLVLHYDGTRGSGVCEAAYLCLRVKTTVLSSCLNRHSRCRRKKNCYRARPCWVVHMVICCSAEM